MSEVRFFRCNGCGCKIEGADTGTTKFLRINVIRMNNNNVSELLDYCFKCEAKINLPGVSFQNPLNATE